MNATERHGAALFYREQLGRDVELGPDEELLIEREGERIVAAVRLAHEVGTLVLRTMVVDGALRGRGIGTRLLQRASDAIGDRECYCIPWTHLESFYGGAGFERIAPDALPYELRARMASDTIAMRRPQT